MESMEYMSKMDTILQTPSADVTARTPSGGLNSLGKPVPL